MIDFDRGSICQLCLVSLDEQDAFGLVLLGSLRRRLMSLDSSRKSNTMRVNMIAVNRVNTQHRSPRN